MAAATLDLVDGHSFAVDLPAPGFGRSFFLVSLPKAGSTLFYRIMKPVSAQAGLAYFSLPNQLYQAGLAPSRIESGVDGLFKPEGYAYGGFRGLEDPIQLPPFASGRTAYLVRDPRDMIVSLYFSEGFSHVPPGTTAGTDLAAHFDARREAVRAMSIDEFVLKRCRSLLNGYLATTRKLAAIDHRLYRYEDVIFAKRDWINDLLGYLGLYPPADRIAAIVERNDIRPEVEDIGEHVRKVSPGDHREKLAPATIARLDEVFDPVLRQFNYDLAG